MDLTGQQVSNYRLIHLVAKGAFAEVYLGEHIYLGTQAAVKVIRIREIREYIELFYTESRTLASLIHPNIIRILDYGVEDEMAFLILEYAPNGTMSSRYRSGSQVPPPTIAPYVKQIASALQYAHDQGLIHGQIMPSNLLLGNRNEVLLTGFHFHVNSDLSVDSPTFQIAGTPVYLAPEQLQGSLLPASDQYALGIAIYEWLSGERPFEGSSLMDLILKHRFALPPSLCEKVPSLSPVIEQVVLRALAKDPQQRFPNIQSFADAFEQACEHKYYIYDVALSFAGEDRNYANALAEALRHRQLNVFYDEYEKTTLWGKNLYTYLSDIYQNKAHY